MNSGEIIATLRDVTVTFDGYQTRSLSRVNLDIRRGEILGILGAKDAGKSTALKLLAGRIRPTEGTVKVFGRSSRSRTVRARMGYLPDPSEAGKPRGFFERLFSGGKSSAQVSRGVSRLAQIVLGNRDLLILDEPFAGLGPAERAEAEALIRELAGRGKTVVLSSDSLMDVRDLCQRLAIFHEGRVQAIGTLPELLSAGGAIRFFPAVLPRETVDRVLKVLREEILGSSAANQEPSQTKPIFTGEARNEISEASPKPADSIDYDKLEGLTKPARPD